MDELCPSLTGSGVKIENPGRVAEGASPGRCLPLTSAHREKEVTWKRRGSYFGGKKRQNGCQQTSQDRAPVIREFVCIFHFMELRRAGGKALFLGSIV